MEKLFRELRRRSVFRVAGVYAVIGWLLVQVAVALETALEMPAWFDAVVTSLLLIGFPIALILAWAFELTPAGMVRTAPLGANETAPETGRKLDYVLLAGLGLVAILVVGDRFLPSPARTARHDSGMSAADLSDKSIAVLPFADMSAEGDQGYFADGLSEELLNALSKITDLKVAGRTSSFAFKGDNRDLREIGEILSVAHILEGSVRKSGNRVRVTAQLVKTSDGFHVFSESYEADLSDIFRVQDEIATKISTALRTTWLGETAIEDEAPSDVAAFDLYLEARQLIYSRDAEKLARAETLLDRALKIDPDYVPALAQKAIVNLLLSDGPGSYGDRPEAQAAKESLALADRAIELDPLLGEAHAARGLALYYRHADWDGIEAALTRAIELNPGYSDAQNWLALGYVSRGMLRESLEIYETVVEHDPFYAPAFNNLVTYYGSLGEFEKATVLIDRVERLRGETADTLQARGELAMARGQTAEAVQYLRRAMDINDTSTMLHSSYVLTLTSIGEYSAALDHAGYLRPIVLQLMGREEEASLAVSKLPAPEEMGMFTFIITLTTYGLAGQMEAMARYIDSHISDLDETVRDAPYEASTWLILVAPAYRDTGRTEEFERAVTLLDQTLEAERQAGTRSPTFLMQEAELAALRGDNAASIAFLRRAMDAGLVGDFLLQGRSFDGVRAEPDFIAIEAAMRRRVNTERSKLGLAPLPAAVRG